MNLKLRLISKFRELFLPHYRSLEFRAKIFSAMLMAKKEPSEKDFDTIEKIGKEIYSDDEKRAKILVFLVKEYLQKSKIYKNYTIDVVLKEIDSELRSVKRYAKKIDFEHLRRLISQDDENEALLQQRIYEFLVNEVKIYL